MKRLTIEGFDFTANFVVSNLQSYPIAEALKKLQEYEDTGLTPEETKGLAERLQQAEADNAALLKACRETMSYYIHFIQTGEQRGEPGKVFGVNHPGATLLEELEGLRKNYDLVSEGLWAACKHIVDNHDCLRSEGCPTGEQPPSEDDCINCTLSVFLEIGESALTVFPKSAALLKELEGLRRVKEAAKDIVRHEHTNLHRLKQALAGLEKEESR